MAQYMPNIADILYGNFIKYNRLYEMTNYAFYGDTGTGSINIFIDMYSLLRGLYNKIRSIQIQDSYAIASCMINLGIHLRAYFETRHKVESKVFLIYGGARPPEAFVNYWRYNEKNMLSEDSDVIMKGLIKDNLNVISLLCPYLYDMFCIIDEVNEFDVIVSNLIDAPSSTEMDVFSNVKLLKSTSNVIYSKDPLSYQLVAFKPYTFLYRPKKKLQDDISWVATKTTLYDAYRYGELKLKERSCSLDPQMFSIYQAIAGVKSRSINSIKNANNTIGLLEDAVARNIFSKGYNANSILFMEPNPLEILFKGTTVDFDEVVGRFGAIDLPYQSMLFKNNSYFYGNMMKNIINLYEPQTVRDINDRYFTSYPLDLNRV